MTKKQGYSTVVCFVLTCIIAIIMFMNGLIVHAEGSTYIDAYGIGYENFYLYDYAYLDTDYYLCMTAEQYQSSSIYDSSVSSRMVGMQSISNIDTYIWNHQDISEEYFINVLKVSIPSDINPSEYPYFVMSKSSVDMSDNSFDVYFLSENSNLICFSSYGYVSSDDGTDLKISAYTYYNGTYTEKSGFTNPVETSVLGIGTLFNVYYSNMPILVSDTSFSNFYDGVSYFHTNPENFVDQNYLLYDAQGNPNYNNPNLGGSGGMSEDIEKGLYMLKGSCIYLSNKSFNDGTLYINALLTDDQKSNPDLTIVTKGSCTYSFASDGVTPSMPTIIYADGYATNHIKKRVLNILWGDDANALQSYTKTVNCDFGMLGSYPISVDFNSDNSGTNSISLSEVNNNMFTGDLPNGTMFRANIGNMAAAYDDANASNFTVRNFNLNLTKNISVNTGFLDQNSQSTDVYLTDVRYHFELYMVENYGQSDADWSDIIYSYDVDMLNGTASVGTDGTLTYDDLDNNFDGDIPSEYLPSTDVNSSGGSSLSSSGGNNQVVTINGDDSAKYLPGLINKLLPSDSESNGGLSEDFQNIVNSNGWLSVIKYSFSFIPESFWDTMVTYFSAILGLLACAFLIRIILDLL